jgi:hypothetical protein
MINVLTLDMLKDKLIKKQAEIISELNTSYRERYLIPYKDCLEDLVKELVDNQSLEETYRDLSDKMCLMKREINNFFMVLFLKEHRLKVRRMEITDDDLNNLIDKLYKIVLS